MQLKKIIRFFFLFLFFQYGFSQNSNSEKIKRNGFILEILGHTNGILSVGYERYFSFKKNDNFLLVARTGIGLEPGYTGSDGGRYNQRTILPNVVSLLIGKKEHYIQIGTGYAATFVSGLYDSELDPPRSYQRFISSYSASVGYRLMLEDFSLQLYPVFIKDNENGSKIKSNIGMCVGFRF